MPRPAKHMRIATQYPLGLHPIAVEIPIPPRFVLEEVGADVVRLDDLVPAEKGLVLDCGASPVAFVKRLEVAVIKSKISTETVRGTVTDVSGEDNKAKFRSKLAAMVKGVEDTSGSSAHVDGYNAKAQAEEWDDAINEGVFPRSLAASILQALRDRELARLREEGKPTGGLEPNNPSTILPDAMTALLASGVAQIGPKLSEKLSCYGDCGPRSEVPCVKSISFAEVRISGVMRRAAVDIGEIKRTEDKWSNNRLITVEYRMETVVFYDIYGRVGCECPAYDEA